jgi:hypothetical protein
MGFESIANSGVCKGIPHTTAAGAANASVAVCPPVAADVDLQLVLVAWPTLPEPIKAGILAMVKVAKSQTR